MTKPLLSMPDFNRIHRVAHGAIDQIGTTSRACMFFACFGSFMLNKHYKVPARPVAGGFGICVDEHEHVLMFGKNVDGRIESGSDGFHMWVQTENHIIDFMSPIYPEAAEDTLPGIEVPRKMLQRTFDSEVQQPNDLARPGDFITLPDPALTEELVETFTDRPMTADLILIAEAWFGNRRGTQKPNFGMRDNKGEQFQLKLPPAKANGAW